MTLKDVKAAVDREGNYRYHFKALDPEFGTVKEEVRKSSTSVKSNLVHTAEGLLLLLPNMLNNPRISCTKS